MTASTLVTDYVGRGTHAARPASPNIPAGATAAYYETDTATVFFWNGSAWKGVTDLLDAFSSSRGAILYRGASAWLALAPGTSGQFLKTQGAGADPVWSAVSGSGGGLWGGAMSSLPTAASTGLSTWTNQGGASVADAATGITVTAPNSSADSVRIRRKAAPATPYTITGLIAVSAMVDSTHIVSGGIGWYDGTNKLHLCALDYNSTNKSWAVSVNKFTTPTAFSANDVSDTFPGAPNPIWLRIGDDGTNAQFFISTDGVNFTQIFTVAKASGFLGGAGYANVCFFANAIARDTLATLMSYAQA